MAENDMHQMYCCLACCGPFKPGKNALRKNSLSARALYYIEGQAIKNQQEFNCASEIQLLGGRESCHVFAQTNVIPVLDEFYYQSLKNKYRDNDTNFNNANYNAGQHVNQPPNLSDWHTVLSNGQTKRFAKWGRPRGISQMSTVHNLFRDCVRRRGDTVTMVVNINHELPICKPCNDIMTQLQSTSHLLVRSKLTQDPLVPMASITYWDVNVRADNHFNVLRQRQVTPTLANCNGKDFFYQACLAYGIHRTLPERQFVENTMNLADPNERDNAHKDFSALGFLFIQVLALLSESTYGKGGGTAKLDKPKYRYKGMIDLYISYIVWIFLSNDVAQGEPDGSPPACNLDFCTFHRYYFLNFLDAIVIGFPNFAHAMGMAEVVFTDNWMVAGSAVFRPGMAMGYAYDVLGYVAASIADFYSNIVRPYFSRHVAGLLPDPNLAMPATEIDYLRQTTIYNMIIAREDLETLLNTCERATYGDTESFIHLVGVHAVLSPWYAILQQAAPPRESKMLESYMDSVTLQEYRNIMEFLKVRDKAAEAIYLECNSLSDPVDPKDEEELQALREAPKCSAAKAALRLIQCGAFRDEEE